jgi:hypothetical protein
MIEVDALERSYPPLERRRSMEHLASLAGSYREVGTETLIVTATIEDDDYRQGVTDAVGGGEAMLVRLEADPETMRERILAREPPGWGGLPELLNSSRRLAEEMKSLSGVDLVLSTEGRQPGEVAAEVEAALRQRLGR